MNRKDYLDNLDTFIHEPESVGFSDDIIPVAMWLRGYIPGSDDNALSNMTTDAIRMRLCGIVDVGLNDIARLMVLNGYSLSRDRDNPEWLMVPIDGD